MTTDPNYPPPPYTPSDPLTPATTRSPEYPLRLRGGDGQIPAYTPNTANEGAFQGSPTYDDTTESPHWSATAYFEERGLRINTHDGVTLHQLFISPVDRAEDIAPIPLCWRNRTNDLTQADMRTFANFLLPPDANTRLPPKLRADLATDEKVPMSPTDTESDAERRTRMAAVVSEWNEKFFYPRGLLIELVPVPRHPPHSARGLDPICQSCVAANNSASRYAAQAYYQPMPPSIPHGIGMPAPPPPPMPHGHPMFPHRFPPAPPMPHGPGGFPHGVPPHAPFGPMPFGFSYLRGGMERLASGQGRPRGRDREDFCIGRGPGLHSTSHGHHSFQHHGRPRSGSSSSSSLSSSKSGHGRRRSDRHTQRDGGPGRGRGYAEARGRRRERHHRQRGRSSSSSSSSSDSSIDSISSRDVRGLGLQDIIRGIAATKLGEDGRKFGLKMDEIGKKFGVQMENVGSKAEAKSAVKDLKAGLREMKREKGKIGKHEKKEVKRTIKGLKKDIKEQFKEQFKEAMRNEKARRREGKRNGMDRGRCGERRSRGDEGSEQNRWHTEGMSRADAGRQVTGLTDAHDMDLYRPPRDEMKKMMDG